MKNSISKNTANKKQLLGQYNTPEETVIKLFKTINNVDFSNYNFLEPSFGSGNIIKYVKKNCKFKHIFGVEIDTEYQSVADELNDDNDSYEIKMKRLTFIRDFEKIKRNNPLSKTNRRRNKNDI